MVQVVDAVEAEPKTSVKREGSNIGAVSVKGSYE
jgi:hypothetical protein